MKDIRNAQEAHKTVKGEYAADFNALVQFVDSSQYIITQQRDSSFYEFNKVYRIDMLKEVKIIDTLGFVSVKDSLFKNDMRYKNMMNVPFAANGEKFKMEAKVIRKNDYRVPVFKISVDKKTILYDQDPDLLAAENAQVSVDEVNGSQIIVGSLVDVSNSGNWPPIYDKKKQN
jgi:DNA replication protein DnaD